MVKKHRLKTQVILSQIAFVLGIAVVFWAMSWMVGRWANGIAYKARSSDLEMALARFISGEGTLIIARLGVLLAMVGSFAIGWKSLVKMEKLLCGVVAYLKEETVDLDYFPEDYGEIRDELVRLHGEQAKLRQALEEEFREKVDFITYLAHDIKTPLANTMGYLTLLNETSEFSVKQREAFARIALNNAYHLDQLVDGFFESIKYSLHRVPLSLEPISIRLFLEQWQEEWRPLAVQQDYRLEVSIEGDMTIMTDGEKVLRILNNLMKNALNYAKPHTAIQLTCCELSDRISLMMSNAFSDAFDLHKASRKFYRGSVERKKIENAGSGLGLSIVEDLTRHLGGTFSIRVEGDRVKSELLLPKQR